MGRSGVSVMLTAQEASAYLNGSPIRIKVRRRNFLPDYGTAMFWCAVAGTGIAWIVYTVRGLRIGCTGVLDHAGLTKAFYGATFYGRAETPDFKSLVDVERTIGIKKSGLEN